MKEVDELEKEREAAARQLGDLRDGKKRAEYKPDGLQAKLQPVQREK